MLKHDDDRATMYQGGEFFRRVDVRTYHAAARLEACDAGGVDMQVLSTVPVMFNYWAEPGDAAEVAAYLNRDIAGHVRDNPGRFTGLGTLPLQDVDRSIAELERCIGELGLAGVEIGTHVGSTNLNSPDLFAVFEAASDLGAAVFVHPWDMMGMADMADYWLPWLVGMPAETSRAICMMIFGGVFERLPDLRVLFAHGGGAFPGTFGRIQHAFEVRPDLCAVDNPVPPRDHLGRFWVDSITHDPSQLGLVADLVGTNRICLGTDFPFPLGELEPGTVIRAANLSPHDEARMLGGNTVEWAGLAAPTDV